MNTKDFVTYEQALALKKLGFRKDCLYHYNNDGSFCPNTYTSYYEDELSTVLEYKNYNNKDFFNFCDAPTLADAQKWFLKEKGCFIEIHFMRIDAYIYEIHGEHYKNDFTVYLSPEEAFSAGITECIKFLSNE